MSDTTALGRDGLWTHSRLLMLTADFDGAIVSVNPAWMSLLGWEPESLIGESFFDYVHPEDRARTVAEAAVMMSDGKQVPVFQNRYLTATGDYRDIDWTAVTDGAYIHAIGRDQTTEKAQKVALAAAEEALRQSQKLEAIGQLTGGVAHDFNNLLTVIRGSVELLKRPDLSPERRTRYLDAVGDTADRAAALTQQLLAFARRQALKPEVFDVGASLAEVETIVTTLVGSRIQLEVTTPRQQVFALADRGQFDTAIVNMAVNARDAMDGAGRLTIAVGPVSGIPAIRAHKPVVGDFLAVTVTDTGTGIAPDQIDRIFEPFYTTKGVGAGTGLSLSQVFGFAKQSEGDLRVDSRVGEGATFTLYLPRAHPKEAVDAPQSEVPTGADEGRGVCVLLVEDNQSVGEFAADALKALGYDCSLTADGEAALAELEKTCDRFHVVFSDVVMQGVGGIVMAERIRELHPDIPVILTSGYSHALAQNGKHGFELLHKPYSIEQLSRVLKRAVSWQAKRRTDV